jgi:hypothetical protein
MKATAQIRAAQERLAYSVASAAGDDLDPDLVHRPEPAQTLAGDLGMGWRG